MALNIDSAKYRNIHNVHPFWWLKDLSSYGFIIFLVMEHLQNVLNEFQRETIKYKAYRVTAD